MNYAVIFAGGIGSRMNSTTPKQFMMVDDKPVIIYTLEQFEKHRMIHAISVVCLEGWIDILQDMIKHYGIKKVKYIVKGAETGQQSIYNGLKAIYDDREDTSGDIVLINDGVRPLVSQKIISLCIECVKNFGSGVASAPVADTVGIVDDYGQIIDIPDRSKCYSLKAPQGFYLQEIISAHHQAMNENKYCFTNSAELFKYCGHKVHAFTDSGVNFKITSPADIELMRIILPSWLKGDENNNE